MEFLAIEIFPHRRVVCNLYKVDIHNLDKSSLNLTDENSEIHTWVTHPKTIFLCYRGVQADWELWYVDEIIFLGSQGIQRYYS